MPFSKFLQKFEDLAEASIPALSDAQKLARFKLSLEGSARNRFDELSDADKATYDATKMRLKEIYEGPHMRQIARHALSSCRQNPSENVSLFADRLSCVIHAAMSGQSDDAVKIRLLDEFLDRMSNPLSFFVKAAEPATFEEARQKATQFELLLASTPVPLPLFQTTRPSHLTRSFPFLNTTYAEHSAVNKPRPNTQCYSCGQYGLCTCAVLAAVGIG